MRKSQFVKKYSVQFVSPSGKASQPFYFSSRYDEDVAQTWQVLRSEFDVMMLENAREKGAEVREGVIVEKILSSDGVTRGVQFKDEEGVSRTLLAPSSLMAPR